jgi:hypothetical protein
VRSSVVVSKIENENANLGKKILWPACFFDGKINRTKRKTL